MKTSLTRKSTKETVQTAAAHKTMHPKTQGKTLEDNRPSTIIQQQKKNNTGLPDTLKSGIENLSGHSLDDVKVHYNSSKPAQLNAHAYAQGKNIHLASGQEKHLPHEAWHIVQQKQGRVQPTKTVNGTKINDNASLEKEADVMGAKALQRKEIIQNRNLSNKTHFGVAQRVKKLTPATRLTRLQGLGLVTHSSRIRRGRKSVPKNLTGYSTRNIGGRNYYSRKDHLGRVTKFAGILKYHKGKRKSTPKVPYKRVNDQAGHLIAHSFGGPAKFTDNFVAMDKKVNSKGGAWGKMESYIRQRLQQKYMSVWMSVKPQYDGIKKRPSSILVSLTFTKSPYKVRFNIPTP
ncbi:DNA/RNA non-specific endonuclease [Kordia algicida OT-1]|uniref:Uncharacterized protein n=1 Tax=Kordia algicida OT-1 TaxID=391587 RepID=A9DNG0_9FLAO|nr:DNA/RNA non-specific endonuclease [Kordia algicida]EDP97182.1 hypothetical protein KAOT1_18507 [Kordia algicida OT-1]